MKHLVIAIDGPAGAGKSTVARELARRFNILYLDTGALYRACAWAALQAGLEPGDEARVKAWLPRFHLRLLYEEGRQVLYVNQQNVTDLIRGPEISKAASDISAHPAVRQALIDLQRDTALRQACVLDGRDIGTNVLPQAPIKVFLTADIHERALRRLREWELKGLITDLETVENDIAYRDRQDRERAVAPLKKAEDATEINTTEMSIEDVVTAISLLIYQKFPEHKGVGRS